MVFVDFSTLKHCPVLGVHHIIPAIEKYIETGDPSLLSANNIKLFHQALKTIPVETKIQIIGDFETQVHKAYDKSLNEDANTSASANLAGEPPEKVTVYRSFWIDAGRKDDAGLQDALRLMEVNAENELQLTPTSGSMDVRIKALRKFCGYDPKGSAEDNAAADKKLFMLTVALGQTFRSQLDIELKQSGKMNFDDGTNLTPMRIQGAEPIYEISKNENGDIIIKLIKTKGEFNMATSDLGIVEGSGDVEYEFGVILNKENKWEKLGGGFFNLNFTPKPLGEQDYLD